MSEYVSVQEYAKMTGVSERTAYRRLHANKLESKEIDGRLYIRMPVNDVNQSNEDELIDRLKSEVDRQQDAIEYLQTQLSQALTTINTMQEDRQRSDTIILQLTKQVEQLTNQNQLRLEDLRPKRRWYHRILWSGT